MLLSVLIFLAMGTFQNRYNPRSAVEAAKRAAGEDALQDMFLFEPASMRRWREVYQEWKIARDQADTSRRWTQLYDGEVEPGTRVLSENGRIGRAAHTTHGR